MQRIEPSVQVVSFAEINNLHKYVYYIYTINKINCK